MSDFEQQLQRLKECLNLHQDQEVAALLGMSKASLSDRKKRGAFPDERVIGLRAKFPTLDVTYVIFGKRLEGRAKHITDSQVETLTAFKGEERALVSKAIKNRLEAPDARGVRLQELNNVLEWCGDEDLEVELPADLALPSDFLLPCLPALFPHP